jgi:hypothetical protein
MRTQKMDDLEAVRLIVDTVKEFSPEDQQRILRWVTEKLSLTMPAKVSLSSPVHTGAISTENLTSSMTHPQAGAINIKTFIGHKMPRNDVQFAAAVAYYYRFEAPVAERKDSISKEDLQEAARKASRERFANPLNTLNNAHKLGLLDKGTEKATFVVNSVGENLIAMTLPDGATVVKSIKKKKASKSVAKKAAARKTKKV